MSDTDRASSARPTPFSDHEKARGARFMEVEGWRVARTHEGTAPGLRAAREAAAILDLSPSGRIKITGKDRINLLQRISANDLRPLQAGRLIPTLFLTPKGRIVDRAVVMDRGESLILFTTPIARERLLAWIRRYIIVEDFKMTDVTTETSAFAITGPSTAGLVKMLAGIGVGSLEPGRFLGVPVEGVETLIAPYDALPAAWLFFAETPGIVTVYDRALAVGEPLGLEPIGVDEAELLRIEAGIPAGGREITEDWNPWEARLEGSFSLSKGCYTGQEVVARLNTYEKVQRRLTGVRMGQVEAPQSPQKVYTVTEGGDEREAGDLTSAARSDRFGEVIGLAFLRLAFQEPGTPVAIGEARSPATVASLPFV